MWHKKLLLEPHDGQVISADPCIFRMSGLLKDMMDDIGEKALFERRVPIPEINGDPLLMISELCKYHFYHAAPKHRYKQKIQEVQKWVSNFVNVNTKTLFDVIHSADFLEI